MPFRFDLVDLRLFLNVVEGGSITAGAELTGIALAAASARILAMEDSLGAALLLRSQRGVEPTPAGHSLRLRARLVLRALDNLHDGVSDLGQGLRKAVRMWCTSVALREHLPGLLGDHLRAHPNVNLRLEERPGTDVVNAVLDGTIDIGLVREHTDVFELETFPCLPDRLVLVAPAGHPLVADAATAPLLLEQADTFDVIGLLEGAALQDIWDRRVAQRGRRLNHRVRVTSFDEQCRLVARGAGIALVPESAALRHAAKLPLAVLGLADSFTAFSQLLCVRGLTDLAPHARALVDVLLGTPQHASSAAD